MECQCDWWTCQREAFEAAGFDDGSCYEFNEAPISVLRQKKPQPPHDEIDGINLLCWMAVQLPTDLQVGSMYTLYWVWDWPTADAVSGLVKEQEDYTLCMDIGIVAK